MLLFDGAYHVGILLLLSILKKGSKGTSKQLKGYLR
jgi:hypothetical protein